MLALSLAASQPAAASDDPIADAWQAHNFSLALTLLERTPPARRSINRKLAIATAACNANDLAAARAQIAEVRAAGHLTADQQSRLNTLAFISGYTGGGGGLQIIGGGFVESVPIGTDADGPPGAAPKAARRERMLLRSLGPID